MRFRKKPIILFIYSILAFSLFFPCLTTKQSNASIFFRFYNETSVNPSITINIKFLKNCRYETINQSLINEFYTSEQFNEYLLLKEGKQN